MRRNHLLMWAVLALLSLPCCNTPGDSGAKTATEQAAEFTPSGDLQKDVQAIAGMIIESSQRMLNGEESMLEDQAEADKMIQAANDYYTRQGRGEEFQKALNAATEVNIDSLGVMLGKGER